MVKLNELTWKELLGYHMLNAAELEEFILQGFHIISCDASYREKVGTCSIQIRNEGKENTIKDKSFVAIGPNEAEIKSILHGIREAQKCKSIKKALFTNDNRQAVNFVTGGYTPKQDNIKKSVEKVKLELSKLSFPYEFALVRSKVNRKVDNSAKKHLTKMEAKIKLKIEKRINEVHETINRSNELNCIKTSECEFVVSSSNLDSNYTVNLESPYCTCPNWEKRWGNKGRGTIFSRALPCKHMCKASEFSGQDIFQIFRNQIFNRK